MNQARVLRNYHSPKESSLAVTVLESILATWADPRWMDSIAVGPSNRQQLLCSAIQACNNPTQLALKEAYQIYGAEAKVSSILSIGSGQRGNASVKDVDSAMLADIIARDCEAVAEDLSQRIGKLGVYYRLSVDQGLQETGEFRGDIGSILSHADVYLLKSATTDILERCITASEDTRSTTLGQLCRSWRTLRPAR